MRHLTSSLPAGVPGCDEDLTDEAVARNVVIPEDLVGLSSVNYLQNVLREVAG